MRYFDHDTTACADSRLLALRLQHGSVAIDLYWTLLERMYADEKPLNLIGSNLETKSVLHLVSITQEELEEYVNTMLQLGLFEGVLDDLYSTRAMGNIEAYRRRAETARQNGKKGGRKPTKEPSGKPSRFQRENQTAKLRKEKKDIGLDKPNQISSNASAGAGSDAPAPRTSDDEGLSAIAFIDSLTDDEVRQYHSMTKAERDTFKQRKLVEDMQASAVSCPAHIAEQVKCGAA